MVSSFYLRQPRADRANVRLGATGTARADWLKMKNPDAPAVKREAEEDWGR
jgi:hypothetical protein